MYCGTDVFSFYSHFAPILQPFIFLTTSSLSMMLKSYLEDILKFAVMVVMRTTVFVYCSGFLKDLCLAILKTGPIPKHIAFIMDGNRRYAKVNGLKLKEGHIRGVESLIHVLEVSYHVGIEQVTIYAFSIENFNRPQEEVNTLFCLLRDKLKVLVEDEDSYANLNKIKIRIIGNRSMIPQDILVDLESVETKTRDISSNRILNVCFPYTSRDDITQAIKAIATKVENKEEQVENVSLETLNDNMYFGPESYPLDILIRTSGYTRLSDFMLWQCSYNCTIEFVETLWPDFKSMSIFSILLKWSFYRTIQLQEQEIMGMANNTHKNNRIEFLLKDLPPAPPRVSVSGH